MRAKTTNNPMSQTIAKVESALSRNPDPGYPTTDDQSWGAARAALRQAQAEWNDAATKVGVRPGFDLPPELKRLADRVSRYERHELDCRARLGSAKQARAEEFQRGLSLALDRAAPHLAELIEIVDAGFAPLFDIDNYADRQALVEKPPAMGHLRQIAAGLRGMRALVNHHLRQS